jgi:hypothetical protein
VSQTHLPVTVIFPFVSLTTPVSLITQASLTLYVEHAASGAQEVTALVVHLTFAI